MRKIIVIGCPGSGKSVFSRALQEKTGIGLVHLDMLYWNPDQTTVEQAVFRKRLAEAMEKDAWIIDGNFASTMELRLQESDTVFFLDYSPEICLQGVRDRMGKARSDLPWVETGEDGEFMEYIQKFNVQRRPEILHLLEKYPHKNIFIFTERQQAEKFLAGL